MNTTENPECIQVVVRIRPLNKTEDSKGERNCVSPSANGNKVQVKTDENEAQVYRCSHCFASETTQQEFFDKSGIINLLDSAINGFRSCVFAFGQTGAGLSL
jgi:hypothetical protein